MVIVGGITRLTGSGLSITEWNIVTGTIPPLSEEHWVVEFSKYQESPEYQKINSHFSLSDFKQIYWWEYIHRLIGRLIGFVFLFPFIYFIITRQLKGKMIYKVLTLFLLGGFQGFLGWYMVKSGLVNDPNVSHYRLAMHLTTAFITFGLTFWFALDILHRSRVKEIPVRMSAAVVIFTLVLLQIIFGAFVAGQDAGYVYNTFPKMEDKWIADSVTYAWHSNGFSGLINSLGGVQFIHRYFAYIVVMVIGWELLRAYRMKSSGILSSGIFNAYVFLGVVVLLQFLLGVFTLIYKVPVYLGVIHQAGAFLLFAGSIYLIHRLRFRP
jgi:cytochrome c oxidase assembly protein subunit 15